MSRDDARHWLAGRAVLVLAFDDVVARATDRAETPRQGDAHAAGGNLVGIGTEQRSARARLSGCGGDVALGNLDLREDEPQV